MSRYGASSTSSGTRASAASHFRRISAASLVEREVDGARVRDADDCAQLTGRIEAALAPETKIRTASGRPAAPRPPSARPRRRRRARPGAGARARTRRVPELLGERAAPERSGTTTVTKSDSPRGSRQTCSSTASTVPPAGRASRAAARRPRGGTSAARSRGRCRGAGHGSRGARPARSAGRTRARARPPGRDLDDEQRPCCAAPGAAATAAAPAFSRRATRRSAAGRRASRYEHGIATVTSQAPSPNFVQMTIRSRARSPRADRVDESRPPPSRAAPTQPVPHHPRLREREGGEDPDDVEVDEAVGVRLVDRRAAPPRPRRARASRSRRRAGRRGSRTAAARSGPARAAPRAAGSPGTRCWPRGSGRAASVAWTT